MNGKLNNCTLEMEYKEGTVFGSKTNDLPDMTKQSIPRRKSERPRNLKVNEDFITFDGFIR